MYSYRLLATLRAPTRSKSREQMVPVFDRASCECARLVLVSVREIKLAGGSIYAEKMAAAHKTWGERSQLDTAECLVGAKNRTRGFKMQY